MSVLHKDLSCAQPYIAKFSQASQKVVQTQPRFLKALQSSALPCKPKLVAQLSFPGSKLCKRLSGATVLTHTAHPLHQLHTPVLVTFHKLPHHSGGPVQRGPGLSCTKCDVSVLLTFSTERKALTRHSYLRWKLVNTPF